MTSPVLNDQWESRETGVRREQSETDGIPPPPLSLHLGMTSPAQVGSGYWNDGKNGVVRLFAMGWDGMTRQRNRRGKIWILSAQLRLLECHWHEMIPVRERNTRAFQHYSTVREK